MSILLGNVLAFGSACLAAYLLALPANRLKVMDLPNERSLHVRPVPRTGGLAIWLGVAIGIGSMFASFEWDARLVGLALASALVGVVSFVDDCSEVSIQARLGTHIAAAVLLLLSGTSLGSIQVPGFESELPGVIGFLLSLGFIVWMTNLYNFMDGMDGFAAGMAVFGFGALGLLGWLRGDALFAALCWTVGASAGGFLVWNFPPARLFMGDSGSSVLGLMAAALSLLGDRLELFPLWIALLVFSPFVVDATVTLIRRAGRGERLWQAHRSHYYQRLVQLGWGHKKTVVAEYFLMGGCAATAVALLYASPPVQWLGAGAWAVTYAAVMSAIDFRFHRKLSSSFNAEDRPSKLV